MKTFKQYLLEMRPGNYALTSYEADEDVDTIDDRTGASGTMASLTDELDLGSDLLSVGVNIPKSGHPHDYAKAIQIASSRAISGQHGNKQLHSMTIPQRLAWGRELHRKFVDQHAGTAQGLLDIAHLHDQGLPATAANIFKITPPPASKKIDFS